MLTSPLLAIASAFMVFGEGSHLAKELHLPVEQRCKLTKKDTTKFRRLSRAEPSLTLRCGEIFFHPTEDRYLTPREYMRIHGFPDSYLLKGPIRGRSGRARYLDQHRQVANSVPPPVAYAIGKAIRQAILRSRTTAQTVAKSLIWGGRTIWIIQDELLRNIELTTRLRTDSITDNPHQNISLVVMHYETTKDGKRKMAFKTTIEGDAGINFDGNNTFTDILLPKAAPNKIELLKAILRRRLDAIIHL